MTEKQNGSPLTVQQTARELNVAVSTIRAWIGQRRIGYVRLGRAIRIPAGEIVRLLEQGAMPAKRS